MKIFVKVVAMAMCASVCLTVTAGALSLTEFRAMLATQEDGDQDRWVKAAGSADKLLTGGNVSEPPPEREFQAVLLNPEPKEENFISAAADVIVIDPPEEENLEPQKPTTIQEGVKAVGETWTSTTTGLTYVQREPYQAKYEEIVMVAALIHCEARGEPYDGQVAVGAVVVNRLRSPKYPSTIREVIEQNNGRTWQFTPVMTGVYQEARAAFARGEITESCWRAAEEALAGASDVGDRLYFKQNDGSVTHGLVIGGHVFY